MVLSYLRKGYSEVVDRQTTDDFIRCLENAFWSFGGVPQRLVLDNLLRAAVSTCDWFDPEINPKVRAFADYYGIALMPTRPYTPRQPSTSSTAGLSPGPNRPASASPSHSLR